MPRILRTPRELTELARSLTGAASVSVDLEADSLHRYREKVCLMQFSAPAGDFLVDTLEVGDLSPLAEVLGDPAVRKIFHAGDYDLRCLRRDFGLQVRGLFDTMIAAQLLGEERIGLADLLQKHFGVVLDKRFQRADWSRRPLSPEMVRYAAEDTRHLARLAGLLEEGLEGKGRLSWAREEFRLLEEVTPAAAANGPLFLRIKGASRLPRRGLALLERLLIWREDLARRKDVPPFKVMGGEPLLSLAALLPGTEADLRSLQGVPRWFLDRHGREILKAAAEARAIPPGDLPVYPREERRPRDPEVERRLKRLKEWREAAAGRLGIAPGTLINNALLEEMARTPPASAADLGRFPAMKEWQRRELGGTLVAALDDQRASGPPLFPDAVRPPGEERRDPPATDPLPTPE